MTILVVTIAGPDGKVDLSVPAETPIEQLMPTFMTLGVAGEAARNGEPIGLARVGEQPLPGSSTLAECGVVDGTVLQLRPVKREEAPPPQPAKVAYEEFAEEEDRRDLKRRAGFPLQRTEAALPPEPSLEERLSSFFSAFFSRDEAPTTAEPAAPDDAEIAPAPVARPQDLTVRTPPSRITRAKRSWRETTYHRRLDLAISGPRLRRCATIAVVSPKGGVGKTTTTALLGSLLARVRHERIVAVDTNPDYGSLGRALAPDHRIFVDDLVDVLDHPGLTVTELERKLGRAFDGLLVLPAPTDPGRMAGLDKAKYDKVFEKLKTIVGSLVLDCGTGLQEPAARSAIEAADQIVLISDAEPSTASLVAEAGQLLKRAGPPMYLVINKLPRKGGRLDLEMVSRAVPDARALITVAAHPEAASALAVGEFSWEGAPAAWDRSLRELATVLVTDWPELGLAT